MAKVAIPARESIDAEAVPAWERIVETRGSMPSLLAVLAHSPPLLERLSAVGEFVRFGSVLDDELRELVTLAVAQGTGCVYEWTHHSRAAEALGVRPQTLAELADGRLAEENSVVGAAVRLADALGRGRPVDQATLATLHHALGDRGVVELLAAAGYYVLLSRLATTLEIELEDGVEPRPLNPTERGGTR